MTSKSGEREATEGREEILERWRLDYNTVRPHESLRRSTPARVGAGTPLTPSPERLRNLHP